MTAPVNPANPTHLPGTGLHFPALAALGEFTQADHGTPEDGWVTLRFLNGSTAVVSSLGGGVLDGIWPPVPIPEALVLQWPASPDLEWPALRAALQDFVRAQARAPLTPPLRHTRDDEPLDPAE